MCLYSDAVKKKWSLSAINLFKKFNNMTTSEFSFLNNVSLETAELSIGELFEKGLIERFENKNGIIWIATNKGLNRYDGTGIKEYRHIDGDSSSISNDVIIYIVADKEQQLWLGTAKGIARFNPADKI